MRQPKLPIQAIPFSKYGSNLAVLEKEEGSILQIINVRQTMFEDDIAYSLFFTEEGKRMEEYQLQALPEAIYLETKAGKARIFLMGDNALVIEAENLGCGLIQEDGYGIVYEGSRYRGILYGHSHYSEVEVQKGRFAKAENADVKSATEKGKTFLSAVPEEGKLLIYLELTQEERAQRADPVCSDEVIAANRREWETFLSATPHREAEDEFLTVCWFNLWASTIRAGGCYRYDGVLMSKKRMSALWSWDHCFNALALSLTGKEAAYHQFLIPFEQQQQNGCIPDFMKPDQALRWACTKPPVHGWCFHKLMERYEFSREELQRVYGVLEKWTNYWFAYRDFDGDKIPEYPMGMDCGWDNCSAFDRGWFVETPDLPSFLILQMDTLKEIAGKLLWEEKSCEWERRSKELLQTFLKHSYVDGRFVSRMSGTHTYEEQSTCLIDSMPVVLGEKLDADRMERCICELENGFETAYGFATEKTDSPKYESDGYWRGPIWAPVMYLLIDGMSRGGFAGKAREMAEGFCRMVKHTAKGLYENFDALTGQGLRAPGYTWTTSVYLLLVYEYNLDL